MADKGHLCLRGLIFLSSLLTGTSGIDETHVFIKSGENVHLSCNNALPDCKSTHWIYNGISHSETVELTAGGIKKTGIERHERLSLGYNCSLNIMNVTEEDYGSYTCRQYVNDKQQGTDARVSLHVLRVSSSSSQTEISAGRSVTLSCQLYSFAGVSCDRWIHSEGIELFWVNQAGVKLMRSDSRYQISAPGHCISTLNTTLLNEDHNREWRCQLTQGNQVKISATYTVKISARAASMTAVIPVHITNSQTTNKHITKDMITDPGKTELSRTTGSLFREILIILETAVFAAPTVILLQIICARRAGRKNSQHLEEI
ncbi:uncharacterized protein LOC131536104 [Onychostoma macrolepis]|uniref:uncharacterized protein LOC131536104 n=1 Tax=Onychostoma macrolepis TaxID=369639 RepID=UPI00272C21DB|nr:uncharacterized protein LOC131536104 [Onychostoma macrolepis]